MVIARAPLGSGEIIIAVPLKNMRCFGQPAIGAIPNPFQWPDQPVSWRPLLQPYTIKTCIGWVAARPRATMVPTQIKEPLAPVGVMKQRGIKAQAIHMPRVAPVAIDGLTCRDIVMRILERAIQPFDIGIDQPEFFAVMA